MLPPPFTCPLKANCNFRGRSTFFRTISSKPPLHPPRLSVRISKFFPCYFFFLFFTFPFFSSFFFFPKIGYRTLARRLNLYFHATNFPAKFKPVQQNLMNILIIRIFIQISSGLNDLKIISLISYLT